MGPMFTTRERQGRELLAFSIYIHSIYIYVQNKKHEEWSSHFPGFVNNCTLFVLGAFNMLYTVHCAVACTEIPAVIQFSRILCTPRGAMPSRLLYSQNLWLTFFGSRRYTCVYILYTGWLKEEGVQIFPQICLCLLYFLIQTSRRNLNFVILLKIKNKNNSLKIANFLP